MANETKGIVLSMQDLREVTAYAAESAREALEIFERAHPADPRPRDAIDAAWAFARGGKRGKRLRDTAWAALRAAREAEAAAAGHAARAAILAASAAYLHPLATATQVKHILGSAAHAARAAELAAGDDRDVGADRIERARRRAMPAVLEVLNRYPAAPPGGGRVGELLLDLDGALRVTGSEPTPRTDTYTDRGRFAPAGSTGQTGSSSSRAYPRWRSAEQEAFPVEGCQEGQGP